MRATACRMRNKCGAVRAGSRCTTVLRQTTASAKESSSYCSRGALHWVQRSTTVVSAYLRLPRHTGGASDFSLLLFSMRDFMVDKTNFPKPSLRLFFQRNRLFRRSATGSPAGRWFQGGFHRGPLATLLADGLESRPDFNMRTYCWTLLKSCWPGARRFFGFVHLNGHQVFGTDWWFWRRNLMQGWEVYTLQYWLLLSSTV